MTLGDIDLHFVSQAWHLVTWILTLRGRRGTSGTGLALVAALSDMDPHFARASPVQLVPRLPRKVQLYL